MKVLVTGGSGKIGGYVLRELLQAGHTLTNFSRTPPLVGEVAHITGDLTNPEQVMDACRGQEAIVHLAAIPGPGEGEGATPERLMYVNVMGTYWVLEGAIREGIKKFIFTSSNCAMNTDYTHLDTHPQYFPVDEEHPSQPRDEYGVSKLAGETLCKRYSEYYGIQTICLRIGSNWYFDEDGAVIAARSGWDKTENIESVKAGWGYWREAANDPAAGRSNLWLVTDARDAAQAFRLALENNDILHEVFLTSGDDTCSLTETLELIANFYPNVPVKKSLPGYATLVSHEKATRLLGYRPHYRFHDWLQQWK